MKIVVGCIHCSVMAIGGAAMYECGHPFAAYFTGAWTLLSLIGLGMVLRDE